MDTWIHGYVHESYLDKNPNLGYKNNINFNKQLKILQKN